MLDQVLSVFGIEPDIDLGLMQQNQTLADFAARALSALSGLLAELRPDAILIQGDTATVMTAALAAYYQGVQVGHVEAGLRSFDKRNPKRSTAASPVASPTCTSRRPSAPARTSCARACPLRTSL
jgi:UDP-N-acetylglucosamine 2-epimerase (non-hydrolysing)